MKTEVCNRLSLGKEIDIQMVVLAKFLDFLSDLKPVVQAGTIGAVILSIRHHGICYLSNVVGALLRFVQTLNRKTRRNTAQATQSAQKASGAVTEQQRMRGWCK